MNQKIKWTNIRVLLQKSWFLTISQDEIDNQIKKINGIYRESLMFKCANENYNELCQIN